MTIHDLVLLINSFTHLIVNSIMSIRSFIAIEFDESIRRGLGRLQERIRSQLPPQLSALKWIHPDNIHLTLKFLGDVPDDLIRDVCLLTSDAVVGLEPFDFDITGCGSFPEKGAARVLWAGITAGAESLAGLQQAIEGPMADLGFPREVRKFSPHITMARIKAPAVGGEVRRLVEKIPPVQLGTQSVCEVVVFQSELTRTGPIYTPMHHAELG